MRIISRSRSVAALIAVAVIGLSSSAAVANGPRVEKVPKPLCDAVCSRGVDYILAVQANELALLQRVSAENAGAAAGDCNATMAVAARYFPADALANVGRIIRHESNSDFPAHCYPGVQNQQNHNDSGLLQIRNSVHAAKYSHYLYCAGPRWFDAVCNLQVGAELFRSSGYGPWVGAL